MGGADRSVLNRRLGRAYSIADVSNAIVTLCDKPSGRWETESPHFLPDLHSVARPSIGRSLWASPLRSGQGTRLRRFEGPPLRLGIPPRPFLGRGASAHAPLDARGTMARVVAVPKRKAAAFPLADYSSSESEGEGGGDGTEDNMRNGGAVPGPSASAASAAASAAAAAAARAPRTAAAAASRPSAPPISYASLRARSYAGPGLDEAVDALIAREDASRREAEVRPFPCSTRPVTASPPPRPPTSLPPLSSPPPPPHPAYRANGVEKGDVVNERNVPQNEVLESPWVYSSKLASILRRFRRSASPRRRPRPPRPRRRRRPRRPRCSSTRTGGTYGYLLLYVRPPTQTLGPQAASGPRQPRDVVNPHGRHVHLDNRGRKIVAGAPQGSR